MRWAIAATVLVCARAVSADAPPPTPTPTPVSVLESGDVERKRQDDKIIEINRLLAEMAAKLRVPLPVRESTR